MLDGAGFPATGFKRLKLEDLRREGEEIFLTYFVMK